MLAYEHALSQSLNLSRDSPVSDFKSYNVNRLHPAIVMNALPKEGDREIVNEFDKLCNELTEIVGDFESALEELSMWKDEFLRQHVPSYVKLNLTIMFTRLFRR